MHFNFRIRNHAENYVPYDRLTLNFSENSNITFHTFNLESRRLTKYLLKMKPHNIEL